VRALFDLCILVALLDDQHVDNARAHHWFAVNKAQGWASCPLTQNGFVRILSQPSYAFPIPIGEAISHLLEATESDDHVFWPGDISLLDEQLIDHSRVLGPKQLTDIYLLALAVKHGGRLVTFDRAIPMAAVRGARPEHLVVI
jgi:toxin-antitoxin system PIN domain toxin